MLYTVKSISDVPEGRNSPATKARRREFAIWLTVQAANEDCVYTDECGFNVWTRRSRGHAVRGQPAVRRVHGQRGKNMTISLAISAQLGLVHYIVFKVV